MARNIDLLERTLVYTVEHQDEWDQRDWAYPVRTPSGDICGTACCFAGNTLLVLGYQFGWNDHDELIIIDPACGVEQGEYIGRWAPCSIRDIARRWLGLTAPDGATLFDPNNTLDKLRAIIDGWKAEAAEEGS